MSKFQCMTLAACIAGALVPLAARADDYRSDLAAQFDRVLFNGDLLDEIDDDGDLFGVQYAWYFDPVKTDGLPLAEAAFLDRSSFLAIGASHAEFNGQDFDAFAAQVDYYLPGTMFYGSLNLTHSDDFGDDHDVISGALGITPFDGLLLTTGWSEDGYDPNITAKYVGKMGNSHFYSAGISLSDPDDGDFNAGVDFDYYFDPTFSLGAGYGSAGDRYELRARKFFTPSFSVGGRIGVNDDAAVFGANVSWRF